MDWSIIIPVYNESRRILSCLDALDTHFTRRGNSYEIIISDDGSQDNTIDHCELRPHLPLQVLGQAPHLGKGAAVRRGILASRGRLVLVTDVDLSTPLSEINRLEEKLKKGYHIAIGSRGLCAATLIRRQPLPREWAGKAGNRVLGAICPTLREFYDTQCGFKLFEGKTARSLARCQTLNGYGADAELLHLSTRRGKRIIEVPVRWAHDEDSRVQTRDYWQTLFEVIRIRMKDMFGHYRPF